MTKPKGFYSKGFRREEANDLQAAGEQGLGDEIAMLRVAIRRTIQLADGVDDPLEMLQVLKALALASGRLAELIRTQVKVLESKDSDILSLLSQAISEVKAEMKLED
jgi:DNA-directed RNA polymerase subunit K/omega